MADDEYSGEGILTPHDHDVLSGRGNFVNYHAGNEFFRALVRKHKVAYVACPKPQKGKFSRMIIREIQARDPPGRFLKQDPGTKLWYDIGEKKALDKTRQALREGAPELLKEIRTDSDEEEDAIPSLPLVQKDFTGEQEFVCASDTDFSQLDTTAPLSDSQLTASPAGIQVNASLNSAISALRQQQKDSDLVQSAALLEQLNRVVPGLLNFPSPDAHLGNVRASTGSVIPSGAWQGGTKTGDNQLQPDEASSFYEGDHFEPTPINPNAMRVASVADRPMPAPNHRGIQKEASLKLDGLFARDDGSSKGKVSSRMEGSSQHLSAMSFSIGDMTDTSNLSAVFEDSMKISDDGSAGDNKRGNIAASRKAVSPLPSQVAEGDVRKLDGALNPDMSTNTFGSLGVESSMMQMSFRSPFDEDSTK